MGSSKKHKKHKSERREKYEEYSNNMDPTQLQRGLKLILKVGSCDATIPTAAEAMMSAAPSSPMPDEITMIEDPPEHEREKHKKSKKKKKKKDREKRHKHHKEKRHRSERHTQSPRSHHRSERTIIAEPTLENEDAILPSPAPVSNSQRSPKSTPATVTTSIADGDSSQDVFSFMDDDNSEPLPENLLFYANMTTDNSPSCRPVSKPIVTKKPDELLSGSPSSLSQPSQASLGATASGSALAISSSGNSNVALSPTKPLPDLLIPSPSMSTSALTPGACSLAGLTPKALENPKTPSSTTSESGREPRSCVLKMKQQKSSLNKLLDHLLRFLEKRDPHQFFAWPVTDDIAPGYSSIISKPMDFSTMRQKIDDNEYTTLTEFSDDFKRMCENAIRYNHVDTVYHKAAKRLLQVGSKYLTPEALMRSLKPLAGYMRDLTAKELGFDLTQHDYSSYDHNSMVDSADEGASTGAEEQTPAQIEEEEKRRALRLENEPKTRFEPYVDDLTSEEILAQVQGAARAAKQRLSAKEKAHKMGFLRQRKDGTTSLNVLIKDENEGPEKVVSIGDLVGKLQSGTGQLHMAREDKRNDAKFLKPLNYGAFASFAPVFDSRFSNLSKEETQLVLNVYGDAASAEYAESILQFTKDSPYASQLANSVLDALTQNEHSKAMSDLYDMQVQNYEEQAVLKFFVSSSTAAKSCETREQIEEEYEKFKNTRIDFNRLRTLKELGIDVDFLDELEVEMKDFELTRRLQEHLSNNLNLIEKLRATQHERLSQPLPQHLMHVPQPSQEETYLAHQITQQLTDVAKKLPPSAVADPYGLRKAMGLSYVGLPPPQPPMQPTNRLPDILQAPVSMPQLNLPINALNNISSTALADDVSGSANANVSSSTPHASSLPMDIDVTNSNSGVDLENELREFLESGPGLHTPNSADDNIVAQLLLN